MSGGTLYTSAKRPGGQILGGGGGGGGHSVATTPVLTVAKNDTSFTYQNTQF